MSGRETLTSCGCSIKWELKRLHYLSLGLNDGFEPTGVRVMACTGHTIPLLHLLDSKDLFLLTKLASQITSPTSLII